jgi:16S rRNA processing protein RimM
METIPKTDCEKIGFIRKTHGVHGEMVLEFEPEFAGSVADADCYFIEIDGLLVPFFVTEEGLRFKSNKTALIAFEQVKTEKYARRLMGTAVYLFKDKIIETGNKPSDEPFLNYLLFNEKKEEIGVISTVDNFSGNVVFTVRNKEKEFLVPFNNDLLLEVNQQEKTVMLKLPEGLLE